MKVVLHIGAHRTATTSFQHYLNQNKHRLTKLGIGLIAPRQTADGLLASALSTPEAQTPEPVSKGGAGTRILSHLARSEGRELTHLVISDAKLAGDMRSNLRMRALYPDIGERMARIHSTFEGRIDCVMLVIRSQESFWASALAGEVARGYPLPDSGFLSEISSARRTWRDIVTDLACALPGAEIRVMPYEIIGGLPERLLKCMTGLEYMPRMYARDWLGRAPSLEQLRSILARQGRNPDLLQGTTGRWQPFDKAQAAAMRECYADDLFWLRSGAEGLARIIEETRPARTESHPARVETTRGQDHGTEKRRLA